LEIGLGNKEKKKNLKKLVKGDPKAVKDFTTKL